MSCIGLIAGTGFGHFDVAAGFRESRIDTPYGDPSAALQHWEYAGHEVILVARHGSTDPIPPHLVNYRANIWALHHCGVDFVLAVNTVGGISAVAETGMIAFPDQLVDYTWGREQTYFDGVANRPVHVDFTSPYSESLRSQLISAAAELELTYLRSGTYGVTQGPRLETAAEIDRLERDGCDLVGMTSMPEAGLARELDIRYASCALIVNRAAGRGATGIHAEIETHLQRGMKQVSRLFRRLLDRL